MDDCYCDFGEPASFYTKRLVAKARRAHRCNECGNQVRPGESYERVTGVWDGDLSTFCTCQKCLSLREAVTECVPCFCWRHGDMLNDAIETVQHYEWDLRGTGDWFRLGRLGVAIRRGRKNHAGN